MDLEWEGGVSIQCTLQCWEIFSSKAWGERAGLSYFAPGARHPQSSPPTHSLSTVYQGMVIKKLRWFSCHGDVSYFDVISPECKL